MYKVNDKVIYKRGVCMIKEIKQYKEEPYYVLSSLEDPSLIINLPVKKEKLFLRDLATPKEIEMLIKKIPSIPTYKVEAKNLEEDYKKALQGSTLEELVSIIKTTYLRNKIREEERRKIAQTDQYYFELAENFLYHEIACSLNMTKESAKEYVMKALSKIE